MGFRFCFHNSSYHSNDWNIKKILDFRFNHKFTREWSNLTLKWAHLQMTVRLATSQDWLKDLQTCNLQTYRSNGSWDMKFCLLTFCLVNFDPVTDRQTDRKRSIWAQKSNIWRGVVDSRNMVLPSTAKKIHETQSYQHLAIPVQGLCMRVCLISCCFERLGCELAVDLFF